MKAVSFAFLGLFFLCCSQKKQEPKPIIIKKDTSYKQSEMAALMLKMYAVNANNKALILNDMPLDNLAEDFNTIYSAVLTDPSVRTTAFDSFSKVYLKNFETVYTISNKNGLKKQHNTTINSCIACHKTSCIGPIPKIKKLLIK